MLETPAWKIATPVDTFEHPDTGSVVDVVSMLHIGDSRYYKRVGEYVMARQSEGFVVQYEDISSVEHPEARSTPRQRAKAKLLDMVLDAQVDRNVLLMLHLGYEGQPNEGLFLKESSQRHDISMAEVVESTSFALGVAKFVAARRNLRRAKRKFKKGPRELERHFFSIVKDETDKMVAGAQKRKWGDGLIIDRRNQVALGGVDGALAQDPSTHICLIWGWGHLSGLSAGLVERGYTNVGHREIDAIISGVVLDDELQRYRTNAAKFQAASDKARRKQHRIESRLRGR